jgi:TPR repeat protein
MLELRDAVHAHTPSRNRVLAIVLALTLALSSFILISKSAIAGIDEATKAFENKDYVTAKKEIDTLVSKGDAEAQHLLGFMYLFGLGMPEDKKLAEHWLLKSANQGNARGQFRLGHLYLRDGSNTTEERMKAVQWFLIAQRSDKTLGPMVSKMIYHLAPTLSLEERKQVQEKVKRWVARPER